MKRIFTYITMLTLAVACNELYGPEETPLTPDKAGSVEISVSDVTDNSFKVTLTPSGNVSYYSYLVDASDAAEELDAETLYKVGYKSLAQGIVKYTAEAPSYSFNVDATPNTTYQIYAVAGSEMGIAGVISVKNAQTSDTVSPELVSYNGQSGVMTLTFSEDVHKGSLQTTVRYFARQKNGINEDIEEGTYTVPGDDITVSGKTATINFADAIPAGAYYTVSYPEGMFYDNAYNNAAGLESGFSAASGSLAPYGAYGRMDFTTWDFAASEVDIVSDPEYMFTFTPVDAEIAKYGEGGITASYTKDGRTVINELVAKTDYVIAAGADGKPCVYLMLPETPDYGATVTISFEEDAFWDIWGNSSAAYEATCLFSFGYTLADITGDYEGAYYCAFDGKWYAMSLTVEESDNPEKGNVMITNGFSSDFTFIKPVYATFDMNGGTLTIPSSQLFGTYTEDGTTYGVAVFASDSSAKPIQSAAVFSVPEAGVIYDGGLFGWTLVDLTDGSVLGWYDVSGGFDIARTSGGATAAVNSVNEPVAKFIPVGTSIVR